MKARFVLFILACTAQPQAVSTPEFEIASVKPSQSKIERDGNRASFPFPSLRIDPGRLIATNVTLKYLIVQAYGVADEYIVGGANWIASRETIFNVEAKTDRPVGKDQMLLMLQRLLADRFRLTQHREKKEMPVFLLVIGKNGSKLRRVEPGDNPQIRFRPVGRNFQLVGEHAPMERLVDWMKSFSGRSLVLDRTGLTGVYDFKLEWEPDRSESGGPAEVGTLPGPSGASIFTAVQEQLGLRLEPKKELVEVLVIDRAEKPSEN